MLWTSVVTQLVLWPLRMGNILCSRRVYAYIQFGT
jgi:hypothetical protein